MSFIAKPKVAHPSLPRNELGLTRRSFVTWAEEISAWLESQSLQLVAEI